MGRYHEAGCSATVEGFLVVQDRRFRLAKTNGRTFTLAEACKLPPGTEGELLIVVDGNPHSRLVALPDGVECEREDTRYQVKAPF
jgi:hypothetical protein